MAARHHYPGQGAVTAGPVRHARRGGSAPASGPFDDFTEEWNAGYAEILGPSSGRFARNASGQGQLHSSVFAGGDFNVSMDVSAYDGAIPGISVVEVRVYDGNTQRAVFGAGSHSFTVTIGTTFQFRVGSNGRGARIDNLVITPV